ncbi:hypothetical protein Patl1_16968 [Pistacia atlantica]|uniref:Uncharacterized protein n=1 Tax=Pistacia atlantica TaxID=434234 RepID=A0ACC1B5K2_9ROSI|nr:hypothetical protein Patl1_16968 [Pistacia atlantica]
MLLGLVAPGCKELLSGLEALKLGVLEDTLEQKLKYPGVSLMELSRSGSSKRAKTPGNGTQVPSCLVDECTADLSKCRDYHRRHKVCELHSKTPKVTIQGQEQRFCQQCSRFHSLGEFDEGKRSCRKRLDGHNRRRRKPQPETLSINPGRFLSNHQGTRFIPFGSPEEFSTNSVMPAWAGVVKGRAEVMLHNPHSQLDLSNRNLFHESSSHNYKVGKQFPFLEGINSTLPGVSVCQPLLSANSSSTSNGVSSQKMFSNSLNRTDSIPPPQSLIPSLSYSSQGMNGEPLRSALVSDSSSYANHHNQDIFQIGPDGSSPSRTHQTLSFSWE